MALKEHSRFNLTLVCWLLILLFLAGCTGKPVPEESEKPGAPVAISKIPADTIWESNQALTLDNGIYYLRGKPFSGFIKSSYETNQLKRIGSYLAGKQHGTTKTFYPNGNRQDERNYRNNLSYGRQIGFWPNGNRKFDFVYYDDKREGLQKQWYESGEPYAFLTFTNDRESGMQKAWRQNGKAYINYEVKDGIRYGLQKAALCYTLRDGKFK